MNVPFWKMHGAGNDFVLIDDRDRHFPDTDAHLIRRMAAVKYGIGSEGVILIQPSDRADFRMRFYNPDGSEVDMCGNGARCVARLAYEIGAAPIEMKFETPAGVVGAAMLDDGRVKLCMTEPKEWERDLSLVVNGEALTMHKVNSGVPHVAMLVEDLEGMDLLTLGAAVRYHERFAPTGTNFNLVQVIGPKQIRVRTYERGVEGETLACGTGMVACGLIAGTHGLVQTPVEVTCASGDVLEVDYRQTSNGASDVTLTGPAEHVFRGTWRI